VAGGCRHLGYKAAHAGPGGRERQMESPGTIIGAGAVVTKDGKPDAVYAGAPARRIR
jgi:hypothetical protein